MKVVDLNKRNNFKTCLKVRFWTEVAGIYLESRRWPKFQIFDSPPFCKALGWGWWRYVPGEEGYKSQ